jgi:hypothetical protein
LLSDRAVHGSSGAESGSQTVVENHGAMLSSNQCVTSLPGVFTVGRAAGSLGRFSVMLKLFPEPGREDRKRIDGSSCPM